MIQSIVADINTQTGESECRYYKERLLYLESGQRDLLIDSSRILSCHGDLKNNRGVVRTSVLSCFWDLVIYQPGVIEENPEKRDVPSRSLRTSHWILQNSGLKSEKYYKNVIWSHTQNTQKQEREVYCRFSRVRINTELKCNIYCP